MLVLKPTNTLSIHMKCPKMFFALRLLQDFPWKIKLCIYFEHQNKCISKSATYQHEKSQLQQVCSNITMKNVYRVNKHNNRNTLLYFVSPCASRFLHVCLFGVGGFIHKIENGVGVCMLIFCSRQGTIQQKYLCITDSQGRRPV